MPPLSRLTVEAVGEADNRARLVASCRGDSAEAGIGEVPLHYGSPARKLDGGRVHRGRVNGQTRLKLSGEGDRVELPPIDLWSHTGQPTETITRARSRRRLGWPGPSPGVPGPGCAWCARRWACLSPKWAAGVHRARMAFSRRAGVNTTKCAYLHATVRAARPRPPRSPPARWCRSARAAAGHAVCHH